MIRSFFGGPTFKDRLRNIRIYRGYTQQNVADAAKIALRSYQKYESGEREPELNTIILLVDFLNVPTDYLLGRDDYLKSLGVYVDVSHESLPRRPKINNRR